MARGGGSKIRFQYFSDSLGTILYLRALQGHSGRSLTDLSSQDNVLILDGFFKFFLLFDVQSIYTPSWIQDLYREVDKYLKDPEKVDLGAPRLSRYMHKAWKKHQNTVYGVDINLALKEGVKFYQTRSNVSIFTKHSQLIVSRKLFGWKLEKSYHDDSTGTPVVCRDASHAQGAYQTRSSDDSKSFNVGDETNHDRTKTPVVCRDARHVQGHEQLMMNEVNMVFRIPWLPRSVVWHHFIYSNNLYLRFQLPWILFSCLLFFSSLLSNPLHSVSHRSRVTLIGKIFCKYNTSWYRNSRTNDYDKWLRKSVYDDKHTFNNGWDHCGQLREWRDARRHAQSADLSTPARSL